ncbi:MAG: response regulator [Tannerellaceae bacterium]|jgi:signal transduction histidine kinase/CheY-like chemotaxis protein|nr:response regulator [Tannerellaceae bacterium]
MVKKIEHLRLRVILGYASMLVVVIAAIIHIATLITRIVEEENKDNPIKEMSQIITKTLLILYECESYTQFVNDDDDEFVRFNQTLDKVFDQLELLTAYSDSLRLMKIEELAWLLEQKRENTGLLLQARQEMKQLYAKHLADGIKAKRDLVKEVGVLTQEETQQQTLRMQRERKGFFRRLAEAFVPIQTDTGVITNSFSRIQTDSLINQYNPSDTIARVLTQIQSRIDDEYNSLSLLLNTRVTQLRQNNNVITGKINQILYEIEEEGTNAFLKQEIRRDEIIENTLKSLAVVASVSLIIILFFLYLILRDISRGRYYRRQLEVAKQLAEDLLQSREKFMLMISHDLRAPLSSILGSLDLLKQSPPREEKDRYMENIAISSGHILSLVNDLLDFHRLESGQMAIRPVSFSPYALMEEIYAGFKPLTASKGLAFHLHLDNLSKEDCYVGDPIRIRQAVGNLLSNAIKFTPRGAISLTASSAAAGNHPEKPLTLSVKDEGVGIPPSGQELIFKEFTRLAGSEKIEGFGLGLSITYRLVSLMGGTISLNSKVGEGSEFILTLPLPLSDEKNTADPERNVGGLPALSKRDIRCLVIDDDLPQLRFTEQLLKRNHVDVTILSNSNDAITWLKTATSFDLILTDIQMPLLDGYALLRQIRSSEIAGAEHIPVIALSASLAEEQEHYIAAGFSGFLNKPFTAGELITLLNKLFPGQMLTDDRLNWAALTSFAGDDKDASHAILRTFSEETRQSIALLQEALNDGNRPQAAKLSHKLIPLFTMLEAHTLVRQLRVLESNDDTLDESAWRQTLKDVITQATAVIGQISVE